MFLRRTTDFGIIKTKISTGSSQDCWQVKDKQKCTWGKNRRRCVSEAAIYLHTGLLKEPQPTSDSAEHHRCKCLAAGETYFLVVPLRSLDYSTDLRPKRELTDFKRYHCWQCMIDSGFFCFCYFKCLELLIDKRTHQKVSYFSFTFPPLFIVIKPHIRVTLMNHTYSESPACTEKRGSISSFCVRGLRFFKQNFRQEILPLRNPK